jgi:ubiquitin C-terminal hydrolase
MHVTTNITPGLITKVNNMTGAWAEAGYRFGNVKEDGDIGFYAGIKPVVLSGSVEAKLPTGVDNIGNTMYTKKNLVVQNQVTPYLRALYTNMLTRNTQYKFSAMTTAINGTNQYRVMNEFRFFFD